MSKTLDDAAIVDDEARMNETVAVTPRKAVRLKAEILTKAIIKCADLVVIATNTTGIIQVFNIGAERMLGYPPAT